MKEKDIHVLIEQEDLEAKQRIMDRVHARVDVAAVLKAQAASTDGKVASSDVKPADVKTFTTSKVLKWALAVFAAVVVITLSVVLPLTLKGGGVRYCSADQYTVVKTEQTLREYSLTHNNAILFANWYDVSEATSTLVGHINDDESDIVFFEESILNGETGAELILSVTDNKTYVDKFDKYYVEPKELNINNLLVKYRETKDDQIFAFFEYNNYIYYLNLNSGNGLEEITEIIQGMLNSH